MTRSVPKTHVDNVARFQTSKHKRTEQNYIFKHYTVCLQPNNTVAGQRLERVGYQHGRTNVVEHCDQIKIRTWSIW